MICIICLLHFYESFVSKYDIYVYINVYSMYVIYVCIFYCMYLFICMYLCILCHLFMISTTFVPYMYSKELNIPVQAWRASAWWLWQRGLSASGHGHTVPELYWDAQWPHIQSCLPTQTIARSSLSNLPCMAIKKLLNYYNTAQILFFGKILSTSRIQWERSFLCRRWLGAPPPRLFSASPHLYHE